MNESSASLNPVEKAEDSCIMEILTLVKTVKERAMTELSAAKTQDEIEASNRKKFVCDTVYFSLFMLKTYNW